MAVLSDKKKMSAIEDDQQQYIKEEKIILQREKLSNLPRCRQ
ncbi:MAG TPA: hypothetical protein VNB95_01315 [Nitrososphaera sp.]|nr:hypothetical protein [Nitrososphaera sp.]